MSTESLQVQLDCAPLPLKWLPVSHWGTPGLEMALAHGVTEHSTQKQTPCSLVASQCMAEGPGHNVSKLHQRVLCAHCYQSVTGSTAGHAHAVHFVRALEVAGNLQPTLQEHALCKSTFGLLCLHDASRYITRLVAEPGLSSIAASINALQRHCAGSCCATQCLIEKRFCWFCAINQDTAGHWPGNHCFPGSIFLVHCNQLSANPTEPGHCLSKLTCLCPTL